MATEAVTQGRRTRSTFSATYAIPPGYSSLLRSHCRSDTTELSSDWDDQWLNRETEARSSIAKNAAPKGATIQTFAAFSNVHGRAVRRFLTNVLFCSAYVGSLSSSASEPAESPKSLFLDWSRWHELREKAENQLLTTLEAEQLEFLSQRAELLDRQALEEQELALAPVVKEHEKMVQSLSRIADLLEAAISKAESA